MLVIPAIDLKNGECVRLRQGDMEDVTVFATDPVAISEQWVSQGAQRLHIVDLDGAVAGKLKNLTAVTAIVQRHPELHIQLGGGIRNLKTIEKLLTAGVKEVIIGTQAVKDPKFVAQACEFFPGHILVGLDLKQGYAATDGWQEVNKEVLIQELISELTSYGINGIIYTDILQDGMLKGPNITATRALLEDVSVAVIASGGVSSLADIEALSKLNHERLLGVIVGRALYENNFTLAEAIAVSNSQTC